MRKIIHIDMDCFYAAVECKYHPELKGLPLGIGGPADSRSVLCTASYEARKWGVKSAMPSSQAKRLCPSLIIRPPRFELYQQESQKVHSIFRRYTDQIEPLSLDEAFLDVSQSIPDQSSATQIAYQIRRSIYQELGLTASAGIAPNKFLAKVASDWNKPNGQYVITPDQVSAFMLPLPIEKLFGIGRVSTQKLHSLGIFNCGNLQKSDLLLLKKHFGARAWELYQMAHGKDFRPVQTHQDPRSVSVEETFETSLEAVDQILAKLPYLYADWKQRFLKRPQQIPSLQSYFIKVKFVDFQQTTCEISTTSVPEEQNFIPLIEKALLRRPQIGIRLLGLGVKLNPDNSNSTGGQLSLAL